MSSRTTCASRRAHPYPLIARELTRRANPRVFRENAIRDNRDYADLLKATMDNVNLGGINVILTPGRYNAAFFEHSYLAEKAGSRARHAERPVCSGLQGVLPR